MYLLENQLVISASDLNAYTACRHLLHLNLQYAKGELPRPDDRDPTAAIVARKGDEHEARYLESLKADAKDVIEIIQTGSDRAALERAAAETVEAMRAGAEVIYQATFFDGELRGHADFLLKVERPSDLGDWSYEVADTKLARRAKPYFILQLCFYSELVARVQGADPELIHVILGTNEQHSYRLAEFSAYYRHARERLLDDLAAGVPDTYPEPVEHCGICDWRAQCDQRRIEDDHLSQVAWITRLQRERLVGAGITTLADLARMPADSEVPGIRAATLAKLHAQASIQFRGREEGRRLIDLLEPEELRGFARLPEPSPGDVFFDLEGDPFFEDGLEYLWGMVTMDDGEPKFEALWGRSREEERAAFERFVDLVWGRRERFPDLHVYHYAHYEISVLKRLAGYYATREEELDQLLRDEVFVDLFPVVRESMRISESGYGLKKVEGFYLEEREAELTDGEGSIVMFEQWLESGGLDGGDQSILDAIAEYNEDDCVSTYLLREWLLEQRRDAEEKFGQEIEWFAGTPSEPGEVKDDPETAPLIQALEAGLPADPVDMDDDQRARWLLAQMLGYHQREARPVWWAFFNRLDTPIDELVDDADCLAGLEPDPTRPPEPDKKSEILHMTFPAQETKVGPGAKLSDVRQTKPDVTIRDIDVEAGEVSVRRGPSHNGNPAPRALIPGGPYRTERQREALRRLAAAVIENGVDGTGPYRACRDILLGRPARLTGAAEGEWIQPETTEADDIAAVAARLDGGALFIQGPPGSGKTHKGARVICDLIAAGNRVGVTSTSHKAIHNLLSGVEAEASRRGLDLRGRYKHTGTNPDSVYESALDHPLIESVDDNEAVLSDELDLSGGTAWHYCLEGADRSLDYLFIDEAGQISLADALALGTASRNIVLLGDPQQLPQVSQGTHPLGSGASVLEHLLGNRQTIPPDEGIFLERTFRMHPEVCSLVSELMYESRLEAATGCEHQQIEAAGEISGSGIRWLPVEHTGNAQSSVEEADAIAAAIQPLLQGSYLDAGGNEHPIGLDDILVVTPYNAQVRCLGERLPDGARVGTVDKFQGQQAQAVFFSMATSSPAELPRSLDFLFSRNRLNVAISRARCIACVLANPALLDTECRTIEQMRLVNALCRVAEVANGT